MRRKFYELAAAGSAPIAAEALQRIKALYEIEADIRGKGADDRRAARQARSKPLIEALEPWLRARLETLSQKSKLAEGDPLRARPLGGSHPLPRRRPHRDRLQHRRARHPTPALGRKNHLFAGSDGGAEHWAVLASLIETCKLNDLDPEAYLADVIIRIVGGHPMSRLDELLPWAYRAEPVA